MVVIVINAISLGLETSQYFTSEYGALLKLIDHIALGIFTLEIATKMLVQRLNYFRDSWNVFDFLIVAVSFLTFIPQLSVLRSLRILRIFLLISFMPKLRFIVHALLLSLPGIPGISILLGLIFYVSAIIATETFAPNHPYSYGSLGRSFYSLFRIMTLDGAWTIINSVVKNYPYAYFFFIPFILFSSYIILNIFIAIIIHSMQETRLRSEKKTRMEELAVEMEAEDKRSQVILETLMKKLNEIDERIVSLEASYRSIKEQMPESNRHQSK